MPQVTSIKLQKRKGWFNVWVDGKFGFSVPDVKLVAEKMRVGKEISEGKLESLIKAGRREKAWEGAIAYLSFRPRSERELREWMRRKGMLEEEAERLFNKLKESGFVDDRKFAFWWVKQRADFRPKGRMVVRWELKVKGVNEEIIGEVLEKGEGGEVEGAKRVAEKQLRRLVGLEKRKLRERLTAALFRRGYSWEVIREAIDGLWENG